MQVTSSIQCNLLTPSYATVYAPQGDTQTRFVRLQLLEGAAAWEVPAGALVTIRAAKPDGTVCFYDTNEQGESAYTVDGSTVTIELVGQVLAVPGTVLMQVDFYNADGAHLSTFTFRCQVSESAISDEAIVSSDYFSVLTETLTEMQQIAQMVKAAYGAPLVAATAAAMTDHTRVYVYTGSESGYTNGNWYYWNGTAWASGGVYNSTAVNVDASPTEGSTNPVSSGGVYAADAALESEVDDLKSALGPNELAETANVIARASGSTKWAYSNGAFSIARSSATVANTVLVFVPVAAVKQFLFRLDAAGAEGAGVDVMIVGWETEPAAYGTAPTQTFFKQTVTTSPASIKLTVNVPSGINYIGFKFVASRTQENLMTGTLSIQTTDKLITKVDSMEAVTDAVTASVKYVSTTGNDVNDGDTPDTAYATIGKALSGAATTIYIAAGNYSELNGIPENTFYRNNSLSIIADNATLTVYNSVSFRDCNVYIVGLNVITDSSSADTANGFFFYHCTGTVSDCTVSGAKYMGFRLDSSNMTLTKCTALNCAIDGFNAHALPGQPAPVITLVNCIAHDCGDDGASVHESGKMFVHGGEFYNNVQTGLAPHDLCEFEAINVHCHHNAIGIEAVKDTLATGETPATGRVIGCILDHNTAYGLDVKNYTVNTLGNAYADNTSGKTRAGAGATINAFVAD